MLIGLALIIMTFFSIFSVVLGSSFIANSGTIEINNSQIINGSSTSFSIPDIAYSLNINALSISLTFLTVIIIAIAIGVGITVLGSGINTTSARFILVITSYASLWGALSLIGSSLITSIEIYGSIIYIIITLLYIVGVVQKLSEG